MATDWTVKELLAAIKLNQLGIPKYTVAEQVAIINGSRLAGMVNYNTDNKALEVYQSGNGSTFDITRLSNFLFGSNVNIGIVTPKKTVYDEPFINTIGKMNTSVFVSLEYLQETSIAGEIEVVVTDGSSPITNTDTLGSDGSPVSKYITYTIDTSSFTIDDVLNIQIKLTQVQIQNVEFRSI